MQYEHHPDLAGSATSKKKREKVIAEAPVTLQSQWTIQHSSKINALYAYVEAGSGSSGDNESSSTSTCDASASESVSASADCETAGLQEATSGPSTAATMMHVYTGDTTNVITHYYVQ